MKMNLGFGFALVGCALTAAADRASAAVVAYDPYNQAVGNIAGTSSTGGGAVWPAASQNYAGGGTVAAGSLSYGPLLTSGNQASMEGNNNANRPLGATFGGPSTDLWFSFLTVANGNDTGISLFQDGAERNFLGVSNGSGQTFGVQNPNLSSAVAKSTTTRLFVLHIETPASGNSITTFYVDPAVSSLGTGLAPAGSLANGSSSTQTPFTFNTVRLGSFSGGTASRFDEFRMGTTWADVSPIPEPTTAAMLGGLGGLGLLRRRRRLA